ncbi:MAG: UDP-N-acetylglucosamine 2-epimerase [Alphaproteobacteria bacterium MarineAlpha2_Bin1]|nr:MAG: UDP-N-acetylglucosamine 2-epimerase [Alphaproteobacteria bacterium MarineAlpha2_Bin1]|tara:strand:- start:45 stop:1163 length:1119 start_codon:yes stop_codon:yes gene_type:complete
MVKPSVWVIVGTRPECIKQAPVYRSLVERDKFNVKLVGTGQHQELLNSVLDIYNLNLDFSFDSMISGQSLSDLSSRVIRGFNDILKNSEIPDSIIVQGDTTSACFTAISAFQHGIKVFHNEAGLRTYDNLNPFPEESNRKIISNLATLHFAPTQKSFENLVNEGIDRKYIFTVGNSGIDSFLWALKKACPIEISNIITDSLNKHYIPCLITAHRRESAGEGFDSIFTGLKEFIDKNKDYKFFYPAHPNDLGRVSINKVFGDCENISIINPLNYISLVHLLNFSRLVLTDSGGIQEEAATLGCPTVICRKKTERVEALELGIAKVSGYDEEKVFEYLKWAANHNIDKQKWKNKPYGNGNTSEEICNILEEYFY